MTPATGPAAGGTTVTIKGLALPAGATVRFGAASLTNVVVVDDTTITGATSAAVAGRYDVVVSAASGQGTLVQGFEVR